MGGYWRVGSKGNERNRCIRLTGTNFSLRNKCHRYEMCSVGNVVNNNVVSLHDDRWQLDLLWWSFECIEVLNHYVV